MSRDITPPPETAGSQNLATAAARTPDVARRIEENRLRAKAIRQRLEREEAANVTSRASARKRPHDDVSGDGPAAGVAVTSPTTTTTTAVPATVRDGRANGVVVSPTAATAAGDKSDNAIIRPMNKKFAKYVDYNLSSMIDTKGGFLTVEDDPWNAALHAGGGGVEKKPPGMTQKQWEQEQASRRQQQRQHQRAEPGLSVLLTAEERKAAACVECGSMEVDHEWREVFDVRVCGRCKERLPDKYSLLTKTECREDYLLTDEELRDPDVLKHLDKPNPHKRHWHDMMLFLRCQVEEYAFGPRKWGSAENLDREFERRVEAKKARREKKFKERLADLKRKTRTDAYRRQRGLLGGDGDDDGDPNGRGPKKFGDTLSGGKHIHEFGNLIEKVGEDGKGTGMSVRVCSGCGMEVEEMVF